MNLKIATKNRLRLNKNELELFESAKQLQETFVIYGNEKIDVTLRVNLNNSTSMLSYQNGVLNFEISASDFDSLCSHASSGKGFNIDNWQIEVDLWSPGRHKKSH